MRVVEGRAEPASEHGVRDRSQPLGAHDGGAVDPPFARRERGSRAAQDEAVDAPGCVHAEPHALDPSEREAAERDAVEAEVVEEVDQVPAEVVEGLAACRRGRAPVAAPVAPDEPEVLRERGNLRLPHRVRGPERARQQERRAVGWAVEHVVQPHASSAPPRSASWRASAWSTRAPAEPRYVVGSSAASISPDVSPVSTPVELLGQGTTARRRAQRRVPHERRGQRFAPRAR